MKKYKVIFGVLRRLARDIKGVSAIEYAVILSGVAVTIVISLPLIGTDISNVFGSVKDGLSATSGSATA
ncbi:MAG TPA: Flp family type IVb pilin, partial [Rhodospirillales bacterium]|nr:Flp family type IVb pilin [Rhodospirillales bacterium]